MKFSFPVTKKSLIKPLRQTGVYSLAALLAIQSLLTGNMDFSVAKAAGEITVTPGSLNGWAITSNDGATATFVYGDTSLGSAALKLSTPNNNDARVRVTKDNVNIKVSDLTGLSYDTKLVTGPAGSANASFRLGIDHDGDGPNTAIDWVVFETYYNFDGTNPTNSTTNWQTWNILNGKFWGSWSPAGGSYATNKTLTEIVTASPDAILRSVSLGMGNYNPTWSALTDNVIINGQAFDFELDPYVPTTPGTKPTLSNDVIFDSIPNTLPANSPSQPFQAQRTKAFGDKITFAGTARNLSQAAFTLSSWACQNGTWDAANCVTTPGATFDHPITLNLYQSGAGDSVGSLIASRTQTFTIPFRPTVDPTCAGGTAWRSTDGTCFNGFNHVITFDLTGITVPDTIIYSLAFNTQTYGESPIGADGPYNALNVSVMTDPTLVGTNVDLNSTYWDSTYSGRPTGLSIDTGWLSTGNPTAIFTAIPADTQAPAISNISITPHINSNTGGSSVVVQFDMTDATGIDFDRTYVMFADGPNTPNQLKESAKVKPVLVSGDTYKAEFDSRLFVKPNFVGNYNLQFTSQDTLGNRSSYKPVAFRGILVDNSGPSSTLTSPASGSQVNGNGVVRFVLATSDHTGVQSGYVKIHMGGNEKSAPIVHDAGDVWYADIDTTGLPEGTYIIDARLADSFGTPRYGANKGTIIIDNTAPSIPTITKPTARQWFSTSPILNQWTAATDDNGISHYQIAYNYDDGHVFGGTNTCPSVVIPGASGFVACRDVSGLSRNHTPTTGEQGGVTIWVRAIDNAGNVGAWSAPVHYYYDHQDPTTDINVSPVVNGVFTVSGTAQDNLSMNRVYVQLVSRVTNQRCGGTTINLIPNGINPAGVTAAWSKTYDIRDLGANCPEGLLAAHVEATDMAGNRGSAGWTPNFLVDITAPAIPTGLNWMTSDAQNIPHQGITNKVNGVAFWTPNTETDLDHYLYKYWNDIASSPYNGLASAWTANPTNPNLPGTFNQGEGTHFYCVIAVDTSGNQSECSQVFQITYDATAPTTDITSANQPSVNSLVFDGLVTDPNLNYYYCWLTKQGDSTEILGTRDSRCITEWATGRTNIQGQLGGFDVAGLESGWYTINLVAVDKAGNRNNGDAGNPAPSTYDVLIDHTAPQIQGIIYNEKVSGDQKNSGDTTYDKDFIFTLTGDEDIARYQLKYWNDIPESPFTEANPWNPTDNSWSGHHGPLGTYTDLFTQGYGVHYFSFSACDALGNCSDYSEPFQITYAPQPTPTPTPTPSPTPTPETEITPTPTPNSTPTPDQIDENGGAVLGEKDDKTNGQSNGSSVLGESTSKELSSTGGQSLLLYGLLTLSLGLSGTVVAQRRKNQTSI